MAPKIHNVNSQSKRATVSLIAGLLSVLLVAVSFLILFVKVINFSEEFIYLSANFFIQLPMVVGIISITIGSTALQQIRLTKMPGKRRAIAGIVLGFVPVIYFLIITFIGMTKILNR